MKDKKNITETKQANGVYVMDVKKDAYAVRGNTYAEKLENAVKDFMRSAERVTKTATKP